MIPVIALFSWPAVIAVLFSKYRISVAILVAIIGGYLLLPTGYALDLPLLPSLNKHSVPALMAILCAAVALNNNKSGQWMSSWIPRSLWPRLLLFGFIAGTFMTTVTNGDAIFFPKRTLQGLRLYDAFSVVLTSIMLLLPFFLAYRFLANPTQHRLILIAFAIAGLAYSFLALYEIRMSPQLNRMVYGYFPHSWAQHVRGGSFRPLVFLQHGLWLAIFFAMAFLGAIGASRVNPQHRMMFLAMAGWILLTLLLSSSLGALIIALLLCPIVLLLKQRHMFWIAAVIGVIALSYPALRGSGTVTGDTATTWARSIDAERAGSLQYRLNNENILLAKARERPVFGWGGWGRARVYDAEGNDISTTDGYWVIIIGVGGWVRYLAEFGLLTIPLVLLARHQSRYQLSLETAVLAIILGANLLDLLPNASMTPLTWVLAGALWGRLELGLIPDPKTDVTVQKRDEQTSHSAYTRQTNKRNRTR